MLRISLQRLLTLAKMTSESRVAVIASPLGGWFVEHPSKRTKIGVAVAVS